MVPDLPSPSRRGLLTGAGLALAGATVGVGATEPTALPDPVTDRASKWLPDPTDHRWHPPVSEAHARDAVERLAAEVERGRDLWEELDTDERFTGDGGWLEDAREYLEEGRYREATFYATGGMGFAAEDVGFALARLDRPEADPEQLAERGTAIRDRADRILDGIDDYPVAEPGRDLGWYHEIERRIQLVRFDAHEPDPDRDRGYDADEIASIHAGNRQAALRVRDAEHYREQIEELVGDDGEPWADRIERLDTRFRDAIDEFPDRGELREEIESIEDDHGPGPYYTARWKLSMWCYDTDYLVADWDEYLGLVNAVEAGQALAQRRAHDRAVDALVMEPDGPRSFDSGHVIREKRAAMRRFRRVVGDSPPPLLSILTARAGEDIDVAEVGFAGSYQRPLWRDRVDAYCYALIARMKLKEYPQIFERFLARE
ncbi:hypothetical protein [Halobaculum roseum]|uniref:Tat (Twin-arginine translocation) pathway signal sequence n=1 Tax=Halobaculum roseum TaxID=2175149 RepID=A0ABD5MLU0_9EURY|nr:hypothetical protein [Halobaculum roseum]QZY03825.1 hypothetical protein K6T36_06600 [Halobaculum roseum]